MALIYEPQLEDGAAVASAAQLTLRKAACWQLLQLLQALSGQLWSSGLRGLVQLTFCSSHVAARPVFVSFCARATVCACAEERCLLKATAVECGGCLAGVQQYRGNT